MLALSPETQLRSYASLRTLETRVLALEALINAVKGTCLHGGPAAMTELIASTAELRWQLRQLVDHTSSFESTLGVQRSGDPRAEKPERRSDPTEPAGMRGTTDVLSVADLVGMLSTLRKTGTLALHASETMFVFEFELGRIVHAVTNQSDPTLRLGTILVAQNKLTEEQLQDCLQTTAATKEMLGAHLVQSATVSEGDLRGALDVQVSRIFDQAFALKSARFTFVEGSVSSIAQRTTLNTVHLLLEAARQRDEGKATGHSKSSKDSTRALDSILGP